MIEVMSVPSRAAAAALLLSLDPPAWHLRHVAAVAEIAAFLALRCVARDEPVNRALVEAAALLHDVDKLLPGDDPARALHHLHPELRRGKPCAIRPVNCHRPVQDGPHRPARAFISITR